MLGEGEDDDDVSTGAAGGHMPDEQEPRGVAGSAGIGEILRWMEDAGLVADGEGGSQGP